MAVTLWYVRIITNNDKNKHICVVKEFVEALKVVGKPSKDSILGLPYYYSLSYYF